MASSGPLVGILAEIFFEKKFCLATEFESIFLNESETLYILSSAFKQHVSPYTEIRDSCRSCFESKIFSSYMHFGSYLVRVLVDSVNSKCRMPSAVMFADLGCFVL